MMAGSGCMSSHAHSLPAGRKEGREGGREGGKKMMTV